MLAYNDDEHLTSLIYQNQHDGRCTLALSGFHAHQVGNLKTAGIMTWPPVTSKVCGGHVHAPLMRELHRHTALANWSKMMHMYGGPDAVCKSDRIITTESLGGALAEILAFCWNQGIVNETQNASIPGPPIDVLYTFGSPGSASRALTNARSKEGCFRGRRVFNFADPVAHLGGMVNLKHARMDALEIWPGRQASAKKWGCRSSEAITDAEHWKPPPMSEDEEAPYKVDIIQHDVGSYLEDIKWLESIGRREETGTHPNGTLATFKDRYDYSSEAYLDIYKYGR